MSDEPEVNFIGRRVLTQAGLDAGHVRAEAAMRDMKKRRARYERWLRWPRFLRLVCIWLGLAP
jgi:hypothetical protein